LVDIGCTLGAVASGVVAGAAAGTRPALLAAEVTVLGAVA
jgi:hypothetical protein